MTDQEFSKVKSARCRLTVGMSVTRAWPSRVRCAN